MGDKILRLSVLSTQYLLDDESRGWHGAESMVREYQVKNNVGKYGQGCSVKYGHEIMDHCRWLTNQAWN